MSAGIEVFVFKGSKFLGSRCFSAATLIIGRGRDAGLKLQDPSVEDRHAMVRLEGGDLVIADTSQSGMTVNGQPCRLCRLTSLDEVAIGPFRIKLSILGQEEQAFGAEDPSESPAEEAPTGRHVEERDDATLPKLDMHGDYPPDFEEQETRAEAPLRKSAQARFSAADELEARGSRYPDERGGRADHEPARPSRGGDPFSREAVHPASETVRGPALRGGLGAVPTEPEVAREPEPKPEPKPKPKPSRGRRAAPRPAPEPEPGPDLDADAGGPAPDEEPYPAGPLMLTREADDDVDEDELEEELWEEPFSLLENIVRERFKTPIETEPYAAVEVIHYADNEILDLSRANPGQTLRVGADKFELIKLESGRALLYFNREFSGTLVSKGKARPLKAFCTDNYLVDDELYGVVMQEGDYAQVLREGTGYLVRFVKPPLMPRARGGLGVTLGGIQAFVASLAVHFLLVVLFAVLAPEAVLPVEGDSERFAKVSLKDLDLEKAVKNEEKKVEKKKEEAPTKQDVPKEIPKETPKIVKRLPKVHTQNVPLTAKQKERAQKKAVANVMTALENLKPAAGAGPGRSDLKALASNISAVRSPAGASANFRVSGVIGRIGGDGVRLAGGFGGGGGKDTKVGGQLLAGGSTIGRLNAVAGTGTKVRGRVSKPPARSVSVSGGQCDRAVIQNVVGANMHAVQACYERVLLTTPGLAGKVVFDWTIVAGGGVGSARMVSSSMASPAVATCILALIRTWRFSPCPIGGNVDVRYPFVFRVSGF